MGWIHARQQARDHNGLRNFCTACGHAGTNTDPLIVNNDGFRIHRTHTTDPRSGCYGTEQKS